MAHTIGQLIGTVIGAAFWSLFIAFILQYATNKKIKHKPNYWAAYKAALLAYIGALTTGLVIGFLIGLYGGVMSGGIYLAMIVIGFLVTAYIYGLIIKDASETPIGFGNGVFVAFFQLLFAGAVIVIIMLIASFVG